MEYWVPPSACEPNFCGFPDIGYASYTEVDFNYRVRGLFAQQSETINIIIYDTLNSKYSYINSPLHYILAGNFSFLPIIVDKL